MKTFKRLGSFVLAALMVVAMAIPAMAADTGSITINNATEGNIYTVYKVFDAAGNRTNISYKLTGNHKTAPEGFAVDNAGNVTYTGAGIDGQLTADEISAIAEYVKNDTPVATKKAEGTTVTFEGLENGYYYITTTTGTAVTITSTNPNATVVDKNEAPEVNKEITGVGDGSLDAAGQNALAQVGTTVDYKSTVTVKTGAENYVFTDTMGTGLSLKADSISVKVGDAEVDKANYTLTIDTDNNSFKIEFNNTYIQRLANNTQITITYKATITSDALTVDTGKNTATIAYGDNDVNSTSHEVHVYNAKITVTKVDGDGKPLAGAGFVIQNADKKYYKRAADGTVSWVDSMDEATELKTEVEDGEAQVVFTGLADGTYTLIEKTVPDGYNKAEDQDFTVKSAAANNFGTDLALAATVTNNAGSTLPSTGGMGTTMFYIVGGILVVGAGVLLITKKRMSAVK